jgi:hypothetical protein
MPVSLVVVNRIEKIARIDDGRIGSMLKEPIYAMIADSIQWLQSIISPGLSSADRFQPFDRKLVSVWLAAFGRAFPTFSLGF